MVILIKRSILLILIIAFFIVESLPSFAVPPSPGNSCHKEGNCPIDPDKVSTGPSIIKNVKIKPSGAEASISLPSNASIGSQKVLIIPVKFNDKSNSTTIDALNVTVQKISNYYKENSYNKLNFTIDVIPKWYLLNHSITYYSADDYSCGEHRDFGHYLGLSCFYAFLGSLDLIRDSLNISDVDINFNNYDHVIIVHSGNDQASSGYGDDIWSVSWSGVGFFSNDGSTINGAMVLAETSPLGTFVHELAHDIGAPDFYDTSSGGPVVYSWDLMDQGSWGGFPYGTNPSHLSSWNKILLNWTTPTYVSPNTRYNLTILPLESNASGIKTVKIPMLSNSSKEYFLVENRQTLVADYDASLPESGIIIWHIDETQPDNNGLIKMAIPEDQNLNAFFPLSGLRGAAYNQGDQNFAQSTAPNSSTNGGFNSKIFIGNWIQSGKSFFVFLNNSYSMPNATYCAVASKNSNYEYITKVSLNGNSRVSGKSNYNDFTNTTFTVLDTGRQYTIYVDGYTLGSYTEFVKAWIDFNNDKNFTTDELIDLGNATFSGNNTFSKNFTVPINATASETRMRVYLKYNAAPLPCENATYGEIEDYRVGISPLQTNLTSCAILDQPDTAYYLKNDIINSINTTCMNITADNITLDCEGHKIDGKDTQQTAGLYFRNRNNITIKNCFVSDWFWPVYLHSSNNVTVFNNTVNSNVWGVLIDGSNNNIIYNNIVNSNEYDGIYLNYLSNNNTISNNIINSNNESGISLDSYNNTVFNNTLNSNNINGISLWASSINNTIFNNIANLNNDTGIFLWQSRYNKIFNNTVNSNNNGIVLYYYTSNNTVSNNAVCGNINLDFNITSIENSGNNNKCDKPDGWNDTGFVGCKYNCIGHGTLETYLISPISSMNVIQNQLFNFSSGVKCVGGDCGNVTASLDPKTQNRLKFVPGELIVKYKDKTKTDNKTSILTSVGEVNIISREKLFKNVKNDKDNIEAIEKIKIPENIDIMNLAKEYSKLPNVEYAEPNYIFYLSQVPNDVSYSSQWAHYKIQSEEGWNITTGSENITIAVIDSGVDWNHPDLSKNIWNNTNEIIDGIDNDGNGYIDDVRGYDFVNKDNDPVDDNGHGTHCSGISAAVSNNSLGVAGVCWNCKIMPVKGCSNIGYCYSADLAPAIIYAADNGAKVISMSWFADDIPVPQTLKDAIDYAYASNVVLIAAAGNDNTDVLNTYPQAYDNVFNVAATDGNDNKAWFSNYGDWIDVAAPGVNIYSTYYDDTYAWLQGTSMAAPHVSGLAGLVLSHLPSLTNEQVYFILRNGVDQISDKTIGTGRINVYKTLITKPIVPMLNGTPFYTISQNPTTCYNMKAGDTCNQTWTVNATGDVNSMWNFFTIYNSSTETNKTNSVKVTIINLGCTDNDTRSCGSGSCSGTQTCTAGVWGSCSSSGSSCENDGDLCTLELCNATGNCMPNTAKGCMASNQCMISYGCNASTGNCVYENMSSSTSCEADGQFCTVDHCDGLGNCVYLKDYNCSANNLIGISTCDNNPDNYHFTWDFRNAFTSQCNEAGKSCNSGNQTIIHTCSVSNCSAECDSTHSCQNKCVGNVRYYAGNCSLATCNCSYSTEDCDTYDNWYNTSITQWVNATPSTEKEQLKQEFRDYGCTPVNCTYVINNTRWIDTGAMRNIAVQKYCPAKTSNANYEWITRVSLNGNQTTSGNSTYSDFTGSLLTTLSKGANYTLYVDVNVNSVLSYNEFVKAWIDFNNDKNFTTDELIDLGSATFSGIHTFSKNFTVPINATASETRMRVYLRYGSAPTPCVNASSGEVEDYKIKLLLSAGGCTDNDTRSCGSGSCSGTQTCTAGVWGSCSSSGNSCDDGLWCSATDYCNGQGNCVQLTSRDCSGNNISNIATCFNTPDSYNFTWDSRNPFTSVCNETTDSCTTGNSTVTSTCSVNNCAAQCDATHLCQNKCVGNVRNFGICNLTSCNCSYSTEDCDSYDNWYNTSITQWVNATPSTEKEQLQQEFRDYSCQTSACTYAVNDTKWIDTGKTRNKTTQSYCAVSTKNTIYEWISNVTLNGNSKTSANSAYSDFTNSTLTTLNIGANYTLYVNVKNTWNYNEFVKAWIDYNNNGNFSSDEEINLGSYTFNGNYTFSKNFTVPANATAGETRMRVYLRYGSAPTPCLNATSGEVEDYKIKIT